MHQLEKTLVVLKPEYDQLVMDVFNGRPILERTLHDVADLDFKMKYLFAHQQDRIESDFPILMSELEHANTDMKKTWYKFTHELVTRICEMNKLDSRCIFDVYMKNIDMSPRSMDLTLGVLSEDKKFLEKLDELIPEGDTPYTFYEKRFFRYSSESYNEAIEKLYPERFEEKNGVDLNDADNEIFVHNFSFQTSEDCNLNCFTAGTKILMTDFSEKNIEDISIGDPVFGFEEFNEKNKQRSLLPTKVTKIFKHMESCYKITHPSFKRPLYVTPEHPMLTARGAWVKVRELAPSDGLMMTTFDPSNYYDADIDSDEYVKGYFIAGFMGDGCVIKSNDRDGHIRHFMRFAVKDDEMFERMKDYSIRLGFNFGIPLYKISEKYNMYKPSLQSGKVSEYDKWITLCDSTFNDKKMMRDPNFLMGFLAGIYDAEGSIDGCGNVRIHNSDMFLLKIVERAFKFLGIQWKYDKDKKPVNKIIHVIRIIGGANAIVKFIKSSKQAISRKGLENLIGKGLFKRIDGYHIEYVPEAKMVYNMETTSHTYIANRLQTHNCTYCYQHEKSPGRMSFEIGKQFIDQLLADEYGYINSKNSPAIILEFIGGEPLLEIELTRRLYEYFLDQTYKMNHPWFKFHRISLCSNGLLYFDEKVQAFFREYAHKISFNISIDGNKQLHDSCRIQPNGEGSYDVDMAALNHFNKNYASERNSKMTLAPENISYLYDSVVNFINNGMYVINLNCVFEDVWTPETATIEYNQLKKLADYLIENNLENLYVAIFSDTEDGRWGKEFDGNFCGGLGSMLSMDYKGDFYPCLRYMPSSIGDERVKIGNAITGMEGRKEGSKILKQFDDITRRTQSNDICYDCPIGSGCAWCSALCFETYATANKRITFHCIQVIAEALANVYYWNNLILAHPEYELKVRRNNVPDSWALKVINQEELDKLKELENVAMYRTIEYQKEKQSK